MPGGLSFGGDAEIVDTGGNSIDLTSLSTQPTTDRLRGLLFGFFKQNQWLGKNWPVAALTIFSQISTRFGDARPGREQLRRKIDAFAAKGMSR